MSDERTAVLIGGPLDGRRVPVQGAYFLHHMTTHGKVIFVVRYDWREFLEEGSGESYWIGIVTNLSLPR